MYVGVPRVPVYTAVSLLFGSFTATTNVYATLSARPVAVSDTVEEGG